jgi:hypothetical protein
VGDSLQFQHWNPPTLSIQDSPIHSERAFLHKQPQDPQMNTVLSEMKKWYTKYLSQCTSTEPTRQ